MKNLKYLMLAALCGITTFASVSCSKDDKENPKDVETPKINVYIGNIDKIVLDLYDISLYAYKNESSQIIIIDNNTAPWNEDKKMNVCTIKDVNGTAGVDSVNAIVTPKPNIVETIKEQVANDSTAVLSFRTSATITLGTVSGNGFSDLNLNNTISSTTIGPWSRMLKPTSNINDAPFYETQARSLARKLSQKVY